MTEAKAFLEGFEILQGMQIYGKDKACLVSTAMACLVSAIKSRSC